MGSVFKDLGAALMGLGGLMILGFKGASDDPPPGSDMEPFAGSSWLAQKWNRIVGEPVTRAMPRAGLHLTLTREHRGYIAGVVLFSLGLLVHLVAWLLY